MLGRVLLWLILATASASNVHAELVINWAPIVGSSTITNPGTDSPVFTPADALQVAGGFPTITLLDGQSIEGSVTVAIARTAGSTGGLGETIRFGLFHEIGDGFPTAGDSTGYTGFSLSLQGPLRNHFDPTRTNLFSSGAPAATAPVTILAGAGNDPDGSAVAGQNATLSFTMKIVRDGNLLDLSGSITNGSAFNSTFSLPDYAGQSPPITNFSWNRMAFLFSGDVNGVTATVTNAVVTTAIPESSSFLFGMSACVIGTSGAIARRQTLSRRRATTQTTE
jgi:hypothetical protein